MALRMVCSSMLEPVTMIGKCGRGVFKQAITSKRFWLWQLPSSTRSMFCRIPISGNEAEISSKSGSGVEQGPEAYEPQRVVLLFCLEGIISAASIAAFGDR